MHSLLLLLLLFGHFYDDGTGINLFTVELTYRFFLIGGIGKLNKAESLGLNEWLTTTTTTYTQKNKLEIKEREGM